MGKTIAIGVAIGSAVVGFSLGVNWTSPRPVKYNEKWLESFKKQLLSDLKYGAIGSGLGLVFGVSGYIYSREMYEIMLEKPGASVMEVLWLTGESMKETMSEEIEGVWKLRNNLWS